jgi:hypothetical protein
MGFMQKKKEKICHILLFMNEVNENIDFVIPKIRSFVESLWRLSGKST